MTDIRLIDILPTEISESKIADIVRLANVIGDKVHTSAAEVLAMTILSVPSGSPTPDCPATHLLTALSINASETKLDDEQLQHIFGCDDWCRDLIMLPRSYRAAWELGQQSGETFRELLDRYAEAVENSVYSLPECLDFSELDAISAGQIPTAEQLVHIENCPEWCGWQAAKRP